MQTTHNLPFEEADWINISMDKGVNFKRFRIGTVEGLWRATPESYEILAIANKNPNNGHLTDVFEWFENSCKRDKKTLKILEVWNKRLMNHLLSKRGFKYIGNENVEKTI